VTSTRGIYAPEIAINFSQFQSSVQCAPFGHKTPE